MAAATTVSQLLAIEAAIEKACSEQLAAAGVSNHLPAATDDLPEYFALPMFIKGQSNSHLKKLPTGGHEYDMFENCLLEIEFFAPRVSTADQPLIVGVYHKLADMAARGRFAFRFDARPEVNARMRFHHLTHMMPLADERGFDEDRGLDRHKLTWRCTAGILPDAWPSTASAYRLYP